MKKILLLACGLLVFSAMAATEEEETTLTKVGQAAPEFRATLLDGKTFDLKDAKGKVVLVNFFATWCGPCMQEMPHLQDQIWTRFKGANFAMVAIDREESEAVLQAFQAKHQFGFPIATDLKREVYSKFASKYIPRNVLIDAKGNIIFQSVGYSDGDFQNLVAAIAKATGK